MWWSKIWIIKFFCSSLYRWDWFLIKSNWATRSSLNVWIRLCATRCIALRLKPSIFTAWTMRFLIVLINIWSAAKITVVRDICRQNRASGILDWFKEEIFCRFWWVFPKRFAWSLLRPCDGNRSWGK